MNRAFFTRLKSLLPYLRPHRPVILASLALSLIGVGMGMIQPYFSKILIDRVLLTGDFQKLYPLIGLLIGLLILSFVLRVYNAYIYTRYSARMLFEMRQDLFAHLHRIPLAFFSKARIGDIYSRIASDMADIQGLITDLLPQHLFNGLTLIFTVGILLWLHAPMALMSFCFLPLALLVLVKLRPRIAGLAKHTAEANAGIAHFLYESLSNTALVRACNAAESETERLAGRQQSVLGLILNYQVLGAVSGMVPTVFIIINTLIVFGYGGTLVIRGDLTVGTLVAFSIYQGRLLAPLRGLMDGFLAMEKSAVAMNRVGEILDIPPETLKCGAVTLPPERLAGHIRFDGVSFAYEPDAPLLHNLSFDIPARRATALIGPSGVGKSTLCHMLLRLFDPDAGRILLDGADLKILDTRWLRNKVAIVSQDIVLFHTSIFENIRFSNPDAGREDVEAAARAACIDGFIQEMPKGYDEMVGDRGVRLSGGQKQRIAIARAILMQPNILIMDEATAFLDESVEGRLRETIRELMAGRTMVIVSHRPNILNHVDHVVMIDRGRVVYEGRPEGMHAAN